MAGRATGAIGRTWRVCGTDACSARVRDSLRTRKCYSPTAFAIGFSTLIDFDFCEQCVADPKQREAHNPSHPFFPLVSPLDRSGYDRVRAQLLEQNASPKGPAHLSISCDLCGQNPLVGVRHKCFDCPGASHFKLQARWG